MISEAFPTKANPNKEKYNVPGFYNHMKQQFIMIPHIPDLAGTASFCLESLIDCIGQASGAEFM